MRREAGIGENDHMSNLSPLRPQSQPGLPMPARGDTIAQFATYLEAQRAVDYLSDHHFPVQAVTIVGVDLQMVERVTGRLTYSRVAVAGALSGAWFGLFVGLLISLFGSAEGFSVFAAMLIGAAFGGLFGLISYAFTGGRRDFTSTSQIVAGEYRVLCLTEQAGAARQLLDRLAAEGGPRSRPEPSSGFTAVGQSHPPTPGQPSGQAGPTQSWGQPWGAQQSAQGARSGPADPGQAATEEPAAPEPVSGPTYSEMIERKRAAERAAAERETADQADRDRLDGEQSDRP